MTHILDRPIWSALETRHAALAEGGALAKRYPASIGPFAAAADDRPESLSALARLAAPGESILIVQASEITVPPDLAVISTASVVQMVAETRVAEIEDPRIEPLSHADAEEMLALATLTKPGPFSLRAQSLGRFWGVKIDGRLAAMAGERFKQPGHTELSGVCTHPDFQGQGLGRLLSVFVTGRIFGRGKTPYLHSYATNARAIALYESIGFRLRSPMNLVLAGHPE